MDKKNKINSLMIVVTIIIILSSCVTMKLLYPYNSINYDSPEQALAAQKTDLEQYLSKISPTKNPAGGSVVINFPSITYIKNNFVWYKGPELSAEMKDNLFNFMANKTYYELRYYFGEAIEKRRIFDKVIFLTSDDLEDASSNADFTLFFKRASGPTVFYLIRKKDPTELLAIEQTTSALPPVQRLILWLDRVEKAARGQ